MSNVAIKCLKLVKANTCVTWFEKDHKVCFVKKINVAYADFISLSLSRIASSWKDIDCVKMVSGREPNSYSLLLKRYWKDIEKILKRIEKILKRHWKYIENILKRHWKDIENILKIY